MFGQYIKQDNLRDLKTEMQSQILNEVERLEIKIQNNENASNQGGGPQSFSQLPPLQSESQLQFKSQNNKIKQLSDQMIALNQKLQETLDQVPSIDRVNATIIAEFNRQSTTVNETMKQNLTLQRQDTDAMVKRLGTNIQDALNKIKLDVEQDYQELIQ